MSVKLVFIVDDDEICQFTLKRMIEIMDAPHSTMVFNNGLAALKHLEKVKNPEQIPDYILLDINMPIMNGWEFLDEFSELRHTLDKNIDLYIISSSNNQKDIDRAREHDINGYLVKPVALDELKKCL